MKKRPLLRSTATVPIVIMLACFLWQVSAGAQDQSPVTSPDINRLLVLRPDAPQAFFFRQTESAYQTGKYPTYESWAEPYGRLQGIMGKCLEEECLDREPRNALFFRRFKQQHPRQAVMLHFNGNARDPRYHTEPFFAGHWIYRQAVVITEDVPAENGVTDIAVQNVRDFRIETGRYKNRNDDIALFGMTADGKHDWNHCEQVQLVSVNAKEQTIRVRRGCYGTQPLAFKAGASRAAAHQTEGPWGRNNHLMWYYNYATHCPRDANGKTCTDHLVDDLARWFSSDGILADFDGIEFDVLFNDTHGDTDGDGIVDDGVIDGVDRYSIGVVQFAQQLRERMGDDFLILADGALGPGGSRSQRAFGIFNGIESEGWPNLNDWEFDDWSGGLNRLLYWQENARAPAFSYVNHKWIQPVAGQPGVTRHPDVAPARHRLAMAAAVAADNAVCFSIRPANDPGGKPGIWDELRGGARGEAGWLGKPIEPMQRLAARTPDLISGAAPSPADLAKIIQGNVSTQVVDGGLRITPNDPVATSTAFRISAIPTSGPDQTVLATLSADPMPGYSATMARLGSLGITDGRVQSLMERDDIVTGMRLRNQTRDRSLDPATGAKFSAARVSIEEETFDAFSVHPPYKAAKGATFWTIETDVKADQSLCFALGMGPLSPQRSDGVRFMIEATVLSNGHRSVTQTIFDETTNEHSWLHRSVPLDDFAGNRIRLRFLADCGINDNSTTDHASWANVRIQQSDMDSLPSQAAKKANTWVGAQPFTAGCYASAIGSPKVDIEFRIEGGQAVYLHQISVHAHPDALSRRFENGMIIANPSPRPMKFELPSDLVGSLRHIKGSAKQDPKTNNGRRTGSAIQLGPLDAVFLERVDTASR
ncbi:hypothetical protein [Crateriforma conspicua]|uniref:hypothetical protein n=1 Tax=Crateriforma conspicua TaxID=2527996 RepID=UPI00118CD652|nr:hypothetical protein [Crateriforma conspicua]QDV64754.1 hypothetical protein Mal65_39170 [Crateriforma conspicua]